MNKILAAADNLLMESKENKQKEKQFDLMYYEICRMALNWHSEKISLNEMPHNSAQYRHRLSHSNYLEGISIKSHNGLQHFNQQLKQNENKSPILDVLIIDILIWSAIHLNRAYWRMMADLFTID
ncbi:unnamed protein product [Paramecium octaurelia]|uniref:Uncharacterized protein n=1 Tax=Paramecium octaurelia TaxID=43137 RepID=A0A8S1YSH2_PAROT|nr:unnamed protein product [Paramecium octaurelia]